MLRSYDAIIYILMYHLHQSQYCSMLTHQSEVYTVQVGWRRGVVVVGALVAINEVALRRARLLLGWVTVCGQVNHLGM